MNLFSEAFNLILYKPLFNALVLIYQYLPGHDFGVAIILLTIIIRFALYPSTAQAIKSQKAFLAIQPRIKDIQERYKNDREKQAQELMKLYREEKINPFGAIVPLLVQLPILIALYKVFWDGLNLSSMSNLYSFVSVPQQINPGFLGLVDLSHPSLGLAVFAGIAQYFQSKTATPKAKNNGAKAGGTEQFSEMFQKQMLYMFPVLSVFILWKLPAAIAVYWITTSVFSIIQQYFILKNHA